MAPEDGCDDRFDDMDTEDLEGLKRALDAAQFGSSRALDDVKTHTTDERLHSNLEQCASYLDALFDDVVAELDRRQAEA